MESKQRSLKVRSFLLPIRSKIKVLLQQYKQNEYIQTYIKQSEHLVKAWSQVEDYNCVVNRIEVDEKLFYSIFYNPETNIIYGALLSVKNEFVADYYIEV
ncbi:MAG TPA: hypothetical protein EYG85_06220 [Crocinitomix sp.]|nr:hypothetical protein [Crocinitomix sp.]